MARSLELSCGTIDDDDSRSVACPLMLDFLFNFDFFYDCYDTVRYHSFLEMLIIH